MQKKNLQTIMGITGWGFLMFYQIFFSPQVKQSMIISNKHGIYELPHNLVNYVRLRILGNQEISKLHRVKAYCLALLPKTFTILAKNSWKVEIEFFL